MSTVMWLVAVLLGVGGLILYLLASRQDHQQGQVAHQRELDRMPEEIASGILVMSEQKISTLIEDVRVYGRTEQVYRSPRGELVPVESKNRRLSAVYPSDVIQTSLQAAALGNGSEPVATHGYVRTRNTRSDRVHYHRVELLTQSILRRLVKRYFDIIEGRQVPTHQENPNACRSCPYLAKCWPQGRG